MLSAERLFARSEPLGAQTAGRLLWLLILLVLSFVAWAQWAMLDEQIRSPAKVVVSSRSQIVQAVDGGVLRVMHVREGTRVREGDLLAELDTARFEARRQEMGLRATNLRADIARLEAELADRPIQFPPSVLADKALVQSQIELYKRRRQQFFESQQNLQESLELARQELAALAALAETGDAGTSEVLQAKRQVTELEGKLANAFNTYRAEAQDELTRASAELDQVNEVLKQRDEALQATRIRAPMAGVVKNISVSTLGAVLAPGDEIMQIVPSEEPLLIEVKVSSRDVAFLRTGMPANVKLDAYDFTVYGALKGEVTYISPDTIEGELQCDEDPYYRVMVEIREYPASSAEQFEVIPGMSALAEIITGRRTVAQYLLKPLLRGSAAALTER